jgi:hypothetical protein
MKVEGGRHFKAWVDITICQFFDWWRKGIRTFGCCYDFKICTISNLKALQLCVVPFAMCRIVNLY